MRSARREQQGQVLVVFAGALITLMAIASLVIDLGFTFMIRRQEQNAADPAAIAAARFLRPTRDDTGMLRAACFYVRQNGFYPSATTDDGCVPANDPNGTIMSVMSPPGSDAGTFAGRDGYVEVTLSRQHQTFLAGLIGISRIGVSSSAVAAYTNGNSNLSSLIALDPSTCQSGKVSGGGAVNVAGYVHVNSNCGAVPNPDDMCGSSGGGSNGALLLTGGGSLTSSAGISLVGQCVASGTVSPNPDEGAVAIGDPLVDLPPPKLSDYSAARCGGASDPLTTPTGPGHKGCNFPSGTTVLNPGIYYGGWQIGNNVNIQLNPGIYIIAGGGVTVNGTGTIVSVAGTGGANPHVLVYSTDNLAGGTTCGSADQFQRQGGLDFSANSTLIMHAMDSGPYRGLLIWQDGNGCNPSAEVDMGGQTNLDVSGTIYAPKALVKVDGGSSLSATAAVQIISWQWTITGGGVLNMPYNADQLYHLDQTGLVR